ncbi:hypothetical protein SteCoe_33731 [Stentor coeruleus]|uniref:Uncharacterized protein n=1 Tax=Stentor coeruleus TaxID=5963 RepID=A0A1R2AWB4_9CILI|nr:hypothetical protein SteCoe_33731 [Stentor coeruleus]
MGLDFKIVRNKEMLKALEISEETRGKSLLLIKSAVELESQWRDAKRQLDEINAEICKHNDKIKNIVKSKGKIRQEEKSVSQELGLKQKRAKSQEEGSCEEFFNVWEQIGNFLDMSYYEGSDKREDFPECAKIMSTGFIIGDKILRKQEMISWTCRLFAEQGWDILQVPGFFQAKYARKVYTQSSFAQVQGKKAKLLIKSPLQALYLQNYKSIIVLPYRTLGFGVCFSNSLIQKEKFSLLHLITPSDYKSSLNSLIILCQNYLNSLNISTKTYTKPPRQLKPALSFQLTFLTTTFPPIKILSIKSSTDYLTRKCLTKSLQGHFFPYAISASFCSFDILSEL